MRRILTAITAIALAFSLVAQATPAEAAVSGYDSQYTIESAFLTVEPGDTVSFTVTFLNTGTTTWVRGSSTEVALATCLEDKVSCNLQDADEALWNNGQWESATIYAETTQASVAPGQFATYTYSVTAPATAAAGTYRFNGALVLRSTGADIHNEGYFQDATIEGVTEGAATIDELDPEEGSTEGGDEVTISGEDFACTPEFPTVMFGDNEADVTSCGETSLVVETPAGDEGDVDVTVTNSGAEASNALTFTYEDTTEPTFDSIDAEGQTITLNFSEGVCVEGGELAGGTEITVRRNGATVDPTDYETSFTDCDDDETDATATVTITDLVAHPVAEGDNLSVTITTAGSDDVEDAAGNTMERATTRSADAAADVTDPEATEAEVTDTDEITVVFSEPIFCPDGDPAAGFTFENADQDENFTITGTDCPVTAADATDELILTVEATGADQGERGTLVFDESAGKNIEDLSENSTGDFEVDVAELEEDRPTIDDAALTESAGAAGTADTGDEWTLTFSENMDTATAGAVFRLQDEDGTIADVTCTGAAADDDILDAECDASDADEWVITILENSSQPSEADGAREVVVDGDVPGLQYPATIIDTNDVTDQQDNDVDLANSDDVVIQDE